MILRQSVVALLTTSLLLAACGDDGGSVTGTTLPAQTSGPEDSEATTSTTAPPIDPAFTQLCAVLNAALGGEVDIVQTTFDHGPLHTLADEVIDIDRGLAARLLVAKEAVESDLASTTPEATDLVSDLESLIAAAAEAVVATDSPLFPTCDMETP